MDIKFELFRFCLLYKNLGLVTVLDTFKLEFYHASNP